MHPRRRPPSSLAIVPVGLRCPGLPPWARAARLHAAAAADAGTRGLEPRPGRPRSPAPTHLALVRSMHWPAASRHRHRTPAARFGLVGVAVSTSGDGRDREPRGLAAPAPRRRGRERLRSRGCLRLGDRVAGRARPRRLVGGVFSGVGIGGHRRRRRRRTRRRDSTATRPHVFWPRAGGDEQRGGGARLGCGAARWRASAALSPRPRRAFPRRNGGSSAGLRAFGFGHRSFLRPSCWRWPARRPRPGTVRVDLAGLRHRRQRRRRRWPRSAFAALRRGACGPVEPARHGGGGDRAGPSPRSRQPARGRGLRRRHLHGRDPGRNAGGAAPRRQRRAAPDGGDDLRLRPRSAPPVRRSPRRTHPLDDPAAAPGPAWSGASCLLAAAFALREPRALA